MPPTRSKAERVKRTLALFGWTVTPDLHLRYLTDALVYNLVNALIESVERGERLEAFVAVYDSTDMGDAMDRAVLDSARRKVRT